MFMAPYLVKQMDNFICTLVSAIAFPGKGTDSQNSDTSALSVRELYHLHFSLQPASPETFVYTLVHSV